MRPIKIIDIKHLALPVAPLFQNPAFLCGRLTNKSKTYVLIYKYSNQAKYIYFEKYIDLVNAFIKRYIFLSKKFRFSMCPAGMDMMFDYYNNLIFHVLPRS